jgi:hypothetical protein
MIIKTLGALAILTAPLSSQVLAREHAASQKSVHVLRHDRGSYNQMREPAPVAPRAPANGTNFDRSLDPSRIGGHDPNFNPSPT